VCSAGRLEDDTQQSAQRVGVNIWVPVVGIGRGRLIA
jgi:hypothetical protein